MKKPNTKENEEGFLGRGYMYGSASPFQRKAFVTNSKKFSLTKKAIAFSMVYSLVFGLLMTIAALFFLLDENASKEAIIRTFFITLFISITVIFILRIIAKRGVQIFSIALLAIIFGIYLFLLAMVPWQEKTCTKFEGVFTETHPYQHAGRVPEINYTCFVSEEVLQQVSEKNSFLYNFMNFKVRQ